MLHPETFTLGTFVRQCICPRCNSGHDGCTIEDERAECIVGRGETTIDVSLEYANGQGSGGGVDDTVSQIERPLRWNTPPA